MLITFDYEFMIIVSRIYGDIEITKLITNSQKKKKRKYEQIEYYHNQ